MPVRRLSDINQIDFYCQQLMRALTDNSVDDFEVALKDLYRYCRFNQGSYTAQVMSILLDKVNWSSFLNDEK